MPAASAVSPPKGGATLALTVLAMVAFAANSVLVRAALVEDHIDPASLTAIRIGAGALILLPLLRKAPGDLLSRIGTLSTWKGPLALLAYAGLFSFAYVGLGAGTGALLAFGAVQVTMVVVAAFGGERPNAWGLMGMAMAMSGLVLLVLPGLSAPPLFEAVLMLGAGIGWGLYSHFGRGQAKDPAVLTSQNFLLAALLVLPLLGIYAATGGSTALSVSTKGLTYAALSGAVTSGLGYVIWYRALRGLSATSASAVQLSAPFLAAIGGVVLLGEPFHLRLVVGGALVLGGIGLSLRRPASK